MTTLAIEYYKGRLTSGVSGGFDFVDVRDVANGIIACCEKEIKRFLPLWFLKLVAGPAEAYYKILKRPPLFTISSINTIHTNARYSHQKATLELGYGTRDMKQTLIDTIDWLK